MVEFVYTRRNSLRLIGIGVSVAGLCIAITFSELAGTIVFVVGALVLASVQPLLLAHLRSKQARRRAPQNGHGAGADVHDFDEPRR